MDNKKKPFSDPRWTQPITPIPTGRYVEPTEEQREAARKWEEDLRKSLSAKKNQEKNQ